MFVHMLRVCFSYQQTSQLHTIAKGGGEWGVYKGTSSLGELGNHHILKNSDQEKTAFQKELGVFIRGFWR